jgi:hypothetical protein
MPSPLELPPEDRALSPRTGFTRRHWEVTADHLLARVARYATPHGALYHLPGPRESSAGRHSDGHEGYARSFLLAAFRLAGARGADPHGLAERYAEGLVTGTAATGGREVWPKPCDYGQMLVEAASIALALYETRPWIWDRLPDAVRQRAAAWLADAGSRETWANNWLLFPVIVQAFLRAVGAPHRQDVIERNLARVDSFHRAEGWYSDGPGDCFDHYVGWAVQLYTLWWCRMLGDDAERVASYRARARRWLADYRLLFAANGSPLHHGRSLVYRFAAAAPFWAGALLDATPLAPGETRRLASGCLRHFLEHGAAAGGLLSLGWHRPFPAMAQGYSGPASPYWAAKGFAGLLLAEDHPCWTAPEEPLAVERGDLRRALSVPGFLVMGTQRDGVVRVASHGADHHPFPTFDPHYRKLGYSTHTAPDLGPAADAGPEADADAQLCLLRDGVPTRRTRFHLVAAEDRFAASRFWPDEGRIARGRHIPVFADGIESVSVALEDTELRIHLATCAPAAGARDGGFALAGDAPPRAQQGTCFAAVERADGLASAVAGLHGWDEARVRRLEGANAFGRHSATPYLVCGAAPGPERVLVSLIGLGRGLGPPPGLAGRVRALHVEGRSVRVETAGGEWLFVQLGEPEELELPELGVRGRIRFARRSPDGTRFVRLA